MKGDWLRYWGTSRGGRGAKLRRLFVVLAAVLLVASFSNPVVAKAPAKGTGRTPTQMQKAHRITPAERKAAAVRAAKIRHQTTNTTTKRPFVPGTNTTMAGTTTTPTPAPTGTMGPLAAPDYFGSVPNYANSPLPVSVSIQGDGDGAFATAQVNPDGTIGGFNLIAQGGNYTLADVVVIGGGGSGASGTATIDPTTGAITAIALATPGSGYGTVPGIRKFVDSLPLLSGAPNEIGQYLPVGVPDKTSFPGSGSAPAADYYEIAVIQYQAQMHSDLPATTLRGYVQLETSVVTGKHVALTYPDGSPILDNAGNQVYAVDNPQYLGPVIVAQKDRPVRIKFLNYLPKGTGGGLFLPVDGTIMGAGMGPDGVNMYSQNRATLHLHGGVTPWISDGTMHQWTTPATVAETYPKGVSTAYVPDMWYDASGNAIPSCYEQTTCASAGATTDPGDGSMTFYYTNQQSARLMFYHDHSYGITRLNVYAGEAAGYLVEDQAEQALINAGTIPADQLPLVIEDKTFVPSPTQLAAEDPTWDTTAYGGYGNLWYPHVYMPNQNPGDQSGASAMGRWDYGPWFWPPNTQQVYGQIPNPLCDWTNPASPVCPGAENAYIPGTPNPSIVPEGFMDTMTVNGTAYPYVTLQPKAYRFRILNASNDRTINLQLYCAASAANMWNPDGTLNDANAGEVPMVAAVRGGAGTTGYVYPDELDGRAGGVPDSRASGPKFVQIGTEGGFLAHPVVLNNRPVGYNYNRRDIVVLNVSTKTLMLGPAERADVIVDFSTVNLSTCSNLIMYNDSPAPVPAFDPRYDYYTGDADQVMMGGAPTTLPGYGPNTRTVMQIRLSGPTGAGANLTALNSAIPAYYGQMQAAPIVPEQGYDQAFGTSSPADPYARIYDMNKTFNTGIVTGLTITSAGSGYTSPPTVTISGGGGAGATAQAQLAGSGLASLSLVDPGSGYTAPPNVTIGPPDLPGGVQATAIATLSTTVASVNVTNGGSGYTSAPAVSLTGGGGTNAAGTAVLTPSGVASVNVTNGGSYTVAPAVNFTGGGGTGGAAATANLAPAAVTSVNVTSGGLYTSPPTVTFSSGAAAATANLTPTSVGALQLTSGGSLFITAPTVSITGGGGANASAVADLATTGSVGAINVTNGGTGYTTVPNVYLSAPQTTGSQATAAVTALSPTGVGGVRILSGGRCTSRTPAPTVTFTSVNGLGSGAAGYATIGGFTPRVTSVVVTNPGSGYTMPPTVSFSAGNCTSVVASSSLQPTSILTIAVRNGGKGYTSAPRVFFSGGGGTGAAANAVLGRAVASLTLTSGGSGYTTLPTVTITGSQFAGGLPATATATLTPTPVASVTVTAGGSYTVAPTVGFAGGGGTGGAAATAVLAAAPVASVTITSPGSYTDAPAVSFDGGTGTAVATGTALLVPTTVASVSVTNPGSGYNTAPTVGFTGGGGSNAAATAALTPAPINSLTITFAGSGYSVAPTVTIDPPVSGTQATATATAGAIVLAGFTVLNPGSGYVSAPTVTISGGGGTGAQATAQITTRSVNVKLQPKGIQELFDPFYGRMNATLSVEVPNTNGVNQTTIPYGMIDPPTEVIDTNAADALAGAAPLEMLPDGTQIWKFTHNGVDTHALHFHMFNIQVINRVGWDGAIRPPDANEMGWKETVRMNPLEDAIVAIKPIVPDLPWPLPNSIRPLSVADALDSQGPQYTNVDPSGNPVTEKNHIVNFGWEYVLHCHLLGHEENDMMRTMAVGIAPIAPSSVTGTAGPGGVTVSFTDSSVNETGFTVQRSTDGATWTALGTVDRAAPVWNPDNTVTDYGRTTGDVLTFLDASAAPGTTYFYRVIATDLIGDTATPGFPSLTIESQPSLSSPAVTP